MEHFVKVLEGNLEEAVKGLTPLKVFCTVLVRECFFLTCKRYHNEYQNTIHLSLISMTRFWVRTLTHVKCNRDKI